MRTPVATPITEAITSQHNLNRNVYPPTWKAAAHPTQFHRTSVEGMLNLKLREAQEQPSIIPTRETSEARESNNTLL